jgi:hypothetical protein
MLDDAAYAQLSVGAEDSRLFIGHPFTCDRKDVRLTFVQTGEKDFRLDLHNPTGQSQSVRVKRTRSFDLVQTDGFTVELKPGSSVTREVK